MDIETLASEVVAELRHPHAVAEITAAVRKAVRAIHCSALYKRDIVEEVIQLNGTYNQAKATLPPFARRFEKVQPCTKEGRPIVVNSFDGGLPCVEAGDIMTMSGNELSDFYYIAGNTFVFRSSIAVDALYLMYYTSPDLSNLTSQTWVTQQYPEVVKDGAKFMYLITRNEAERAQAHRMLYEDQLDKLFSEQGGKR